MKHFPIILCFSSVGGYCMGKFTCATCEKENIWKFEHFERYFNKSVILRCEEEL